MKEVLERVKHLADDFLFEHYYSLDRKKAAEEAGDEKDQYFEGGYGLAYKEAFGEITDLQTWIKLLVKEEEAKGEREVPVVRGG